MATRNVFLESRISFHYYDCVWDECFCKHDATVPVQLILAKWYERTHPFSPPSNSVQPNNGVAECNFKLDLVVLFTIDKTLLRRIIVSLSVSKLKLCLSSEVPRFFLVSICRINVCKINFLVKRWQRFSKFIFFYRVKAIWNWMHSSTCCTGGLRGSVTFQEKRVSLK